MSWYLDALPWLGAGVLVLALLALAVVYYPVRFDVSARARGEADGSWFVAGGASLGALSLTFVWARNVAPKVGVLLFGRKLDAGGDWGRRLTKPVPRRVRTATQKAWTRADPLGLTLKLVSERRHFRLRYLVLDLSYGFRDPLLTGRLSGAIAVLSAVLPARVTVRQSPRWDFEDGWEVAVDGRAFLKPLLVLLETAFYVCRRPVARSAASRSPRAA